MTESTQSDTEFRPVSPKELALVITMHRQGLGWTQETLAEISGLTVRTIQRVENAEPSSVDTRRALARAFKIEDIDVFNKPREFSSPDKIRRDVEEFQKNNLTLAVNVARSGKELLDLADDTNVYCFQQPDGVPEDAAFNVACVFDNLRDYGDVRDVYSFTDKLELHKILDQCLSDLSKQSFSVCYARRNTKIVGRDWADKTPLAWSITYIFITKKGGEPKHVVVPKAVSIN